MGETSILKLIHVAVVATGARIFRNNVGVLQDRFGQYVAYGLCPGSSDLIGWTPLEITPEMVGKKLAVFTAIEVKTKEGRSTVEQDQFLKVVEAAGGIGFIARSTEEALAKLKERSNALQK